MIFLVKVGYFFLFFSFFFFLIFVQARVVVDSEEHISVGKWLRFFFIYKHHLRQHLLTDNLFYRLITPIPNHLASAEFRTSQWRCFTNNQNGYFVLFPFYSPFCSLSLTYPFPLLSSISTNLPPLLFRPSQRPLLSHCGRQPQQTLVVLKCLRLVKEVMMATMNWPSSDVIALPAPVMV